MADLIYLSSDDIEACDVPMDRIISVVEDAYRFKGNGGVEMPPKPGIHPRKDCLIHAMPAFINDLGSAGMKWISAYPPNSLKGMPQISGLIILNDPETGFPISIMDCRWITAKRTGAKTAISASLLANKDSSQVGIIGCGIQGRSNLEALACRFGISNVCVYDVNRASAETFVDEAKSRYPFEFRVADSVEEAVNEMDIIVTAGVIQRDPRPVIDASWLKAGSYSAPVDFDSYFTGKAMDAMDVFVTDDVAQFEYYRSIGYFQQAPIGSRILDLGQVVNNAVLCRRDRKQRTMAMNLGLGMDDIAVAPLIYKVAIQKGLGTRLPI